MTCGDIKNIVWVFLALCGPGLSQDSDEWSRFFGTPPATSSASSISANSEVAAAWKVLLVGPRYERRDARAALSALGPSTGLRLLPELDAESSEARRQAAFTLGYVDSPAVRQALLRCVTGRKARRDEVRLRHAAWALGALDEPAAIPLLVEQLAQVKRPLTRHLILVALSRLGRGSDETSTAIMRGRDRDRSLAGRVVLALTLGEIPRAELAEKWLASLRSSRRDELRLAAHLASAGRPSEKPLPLKGMRGERDERVLRAALLGVATGAFQDKGFVRRALNHEDEGVRRAAILARGRAQAGEAAKDLLARLGRERSAELRAAILFALRDRPEESVRKALREALKAKKSEVESRAAFLALALSNPEDLNLEARIREREEPLSLAFDLLLRADPARAEALANGIVEGKAKGKRGRALAAKARALRSDLDRGAAFARRLAAVRLQVAIDEAGWSVDWERTRLAYALFKRVENLDRPLDGKESLRVTATGATRPVPRMNKEEEDLRLWFDRHPPFDRREDLEIPELAADPH